MQLSSAKRHIILLLLKKISLYPFPALLLCLLPSWIRWLTDLFLNFTERKPLCALVFWCPSLIILTHRILFHYRNITTHVLPLTGMSYFHPETIMKWDNSHAKQQMLVWGWQKQHCSFQTSSTICIFQHAASSSLESVCFPCECGMLESSLLT